jgi:hypothetical protein
MFKEAPHIPKHGNRFFHSKVYLSEVEKTKSHERKNAFNAMYCKITQCIIQTKE